MQGFEHSGCSGNYCRIVISTQHCLWNTCLYLPPHSGWQGRGTNSLKSRSNLIEDAEITCGGGQDAGQTVASWLWASNWATPLSACWYLDLAKPQVCGRVWGGAVSVRVPLWLLWGALWEGRLCICDWVCKAVCSHMDLIPRTYVVKISLVLCFCFSQPSQEVNTLELYIYCAVSHLFLLIYAYFPKRI